jgi:acyl-CoA thioesterase-1
VGPRIGVLLLAIAGAYLTVDLIFAYRDYKSLPQHSPRDFMKRGRSQETRFVVVTAGDSVTQGTFSADYVGFLRDRLGAKGYEFVNAGVNGEKSADLLNRIQSTVDCKPDAITILIGINDVQAVVGMGGRSRPAAESDGLDPFRRNLEQIVTLVQSETSAPIALLSIPPA